MTASTQAHRHGTAGTLYVVSAPSGAGKTSLVQALADVDAGVVVSVSHTTRAPREREIDGVDYHFVDTATFEAMLRENAFLEHARVFNNYYGTARNWVQGELDAGRDVVLEIDWQGARQIRAAVPCVSVFVLPPSRAALAARLRTRAQDGDAVIAERMSRALGEMSHHDEFDYLVVNDVFDHALGDLHAIVRTRRLRRMPTRQPHAALLATLFDPHGGE